MTPATLLFYYFVGVVFCLPVDPPDINYEMNKVFNMRPRSSDWEAGFNEAKAYLIPKITDLQSKLKTLRKIYVKFTPRAMIDYVKEKFEKAYLEQMNSYRKEITDLENKQKEYPGKITHLENGLKNPKLTAQKIQEDNATISHYKSELEQILSKLENYRKRLPDPIWSKGNTHRHRVLKKKHVWLWIDENQRKDIHVKRIRAYIDKWYSNKCEEFKNMHTLDEYADIMYESIAEIEEKINSQAHAVVRIPIQKGYEFKKFSIYGVPNLDECTTILINAVGLEYIEDLKNDEVIQIPGAEIQQLSVPGF